MLIKWSQQGWRDSPSHLLATKYWSCKSDINLRLNFGKKIAAKSRQKKIWREKCKILPTILGAAVALRCKRCSIFNSVTEFSQAFSPSTRILEGKVSNLLKAKQIWNWKSSSYEKAVLYFGIIKNTNSKLKTLKFKRENKR